MTKEEAVEIVLFPETRFLPCPTCKGDPDRPEVRTYITPTRYLRCKRCHGRGKVYAAPLRVRARKLLGLPVQKWA